jgi:hypothetical protein
MNSPFLVPTYVQPTQKRNRKSTAIILIVVLGILLGGGLVLITSLNKAFQNSVKLAEGVAANPSAAQSYSLSEDQSGIIDQYGYPDSFTITFYDEEFDPNYDGEVRDETWRYYSSGIEFDFYNGLLMYTNPIPDPPTRWVVLPYRPEQFTAYSDLETILASAQITDFIEFPLEKELINNGKLYYASGLTFGTVDGRLIYVETIMMQEDEG